MENYIDNQTTFHVRFSEIDMINVVHHSRYWVWFEESKFNFLNKILGITADDVIASNYLMPVINCSCSYITPIKWHDKIRVKTTLEVKNTPYLTFHHEIYLYDDFECENVLCKATIKHAVVDSKFNLKLRVPSFITNAIKQNINTKEYAFIY